MRRRTTTKQLNTAITNNLLSIVKAECHYKSSDRIDEISAEKFKNDFDFLCESGVFAESLGWHYEKDCKTGLYIAECGRMNPDVEIIVTVYLDVCNGAYREEVERVLIMGEEE